MLNLLITAFHLIFFGFVIAASFYNGSPSNLVKPKGFAPFGVRGVVDGAAIVYFSYIGYDSVSTMAEEIKYPSKSLPVGIFGSVIIVSALYCLMALSLSSMIPYNQISEGASFSSAFESKVGWKWAGNAVGGGASLGIVASLLVAMLAQARYLCVIARARLAPSWLAHVHPSKGTPMNATIFLGICTAAIALFTDLEIVLEIISIGTLTVFYLVANALIYRRYVSLGANKPLPILLFLLLLTASSTAFSISWRLQRSSYWWLMALFGGFTAAATALFQRKVPCRHRPLKWSLPLMPWPAAASIFLNIFLLSSLKQRSFQRFAVWNCVVVLFYVLYGVHSTFQAEEVEVEVDVEREMALAVGNGPNSSSQLAKLEA